MNWYNISVNHQPIARLKASSPRVAINRALTKLPNSAILDGAIIQAWRGPRVKYSYHVCGYKESNQGSKVWTKLSPPFSRRAEARAYAFINKITQFTIGVEAE